MRIMQFIFELIVVFQELSFTFDFVLIAKFPTSIFSTLLLLLNKNTRLKPPN